MHIAVKFGVWAEVRPMTFHNAPQKLGLQYIGRLRGLTEAMTKKLVALSSKLACKSAESYRRARGVSKAVLYRLSARCRYTNKAVGDDLLVTRHFCPL